MPNHIITADQAAKSLMESAVEAVKEVSPDTPGQTEEINYYQGRLLAMVLNGFSRRMFYGPSLKGN